MSEETKPQTQHQEEDENNKEISSTQTTPADEQASKSEFKDKEKVFEPLAESTVKPRSEFKLLHFTGDNCGVKIENWMKMYISLAKRSDWSEEEMKWNLPAYLEEEAFNFYIEQVLSKEDLDWTKAKDLMLLRFDQYEMEPFMQFLSLKWTPKVDLRDHFKLVRSIGFRAGLGEQAIISGLTNSLPQHLRGELQCVHTLQQLWASAFCLQQKMEERGNGYYKHSSYKGRGRGGNRQNQNQNQKPRSNHSQANQLLTNNNKAASGDHHDA